MSQLTTNTASLEAILETINALPEQTAEAKLQEKSITPTTSSQIVSPDSGYDGLSKVTVNAMPTATQATPTISVSSAGLITASSTQTAGYVAAGTKSATKQLSTQAAQTITPGTSNKTIASGKYLTGTQTIKGDANLIPANIAEGISIFGVEGTMKAGGGSSFPNGAEWTELTVPFRSCNDINYARGIWTSATFTGVWYSTDGFTWTQSNLIESMNGHGAIHSANGLWVAITDGNNVYHSSDGITWTLNSNISDQLSKVNTAQWCVYEANGVWVFWTLNESQLYATTDWNSMQVVTINNCCCVRYARGIWVATSSVGIWYSTDGFTWTKSNITSGSYDDVVYADGVWCAISESNVSYGLVRSTDGMQWTVVYNKYNPFAHIYYANGLCIANNVYDGCLYSYDCQTWNTCNIVTSEDDESSETPEGPGGPGSPPPVIGGDSDTAAYCFHNVKYACGMWVATDVNDRSMWHSIDGITWTESTMTRSNVVIEKFVNHNGLWLSAPTNTTDSYILYSITWKPST